MCTYKELETIELPNEEITGTDSVLISKQKGRKIEHFNN